MRSRTQARKPVPSFDLLERRDFLSSPGGSAGMLLDHLGISQLTDQVTAHRDDVHHHRHDPISHMIESAKKKKKTPAPVVGSQGPAGPQGP
jgi:hypothetical protein